MNEETDADAGADSAEWSNEYAEAVLEFLAECEPGPAERPLAVQLKALARTLDRMMRAEGAVQSAAASQFAGTWARLAKRTAPAGGGAGGDGLDQWLTPIPGLEDGLQHGAGCRCAACTA